MRFCWCTLQVGDMEASLQFYQQIVGLDLDKRFAAGPGVEIAFLGKGETQVELIQNKNQPSAGMGQDISLGFEVASIDDMMEFVKRNGLPIHSGPFQPNPHTRFFYVLDPNDLKIQFVQHM